MSKIARLIVNKALDIGLLDYRIPEDILGIGPGMAVKVPLGKRNQITSAYVAELVSTQDDLTYKDILAPDTDRPTLPDNLLKLILFAAQYYRCSASLLLGAALPQQARTPTPRYTLTSLGKEIDEASPKTQSLLAWARQQKNGFTAQSAAKFLGIKNARLNELLDKQWIVPKIIKKRARSKAFDISEHLLKVHHETLVLTDEQKGAIEQIVPHMDARQFQAFLLQGVTGSGKTEIYLQLIEKALKENRTALVLVPEIALTPQLGARFIHRFGDKVAIFHSGLTPQQRQHVYQEILDNSACIALGARSAIFLPLQNLGVVIVDEEHETSFKQEESPRYNARDLAVFRAQQDNAVVVLGSATPSLESRHNADLGRYRHLPLRKRVLDRPLPRVRCIDLKHQKTPTILSAPLVECIDATLKKNEQVILFLNRRGFAPCVLCRQCGHTFRCPDCNVGMTLHQRKQILLCHYCAFEISAPEICPSCQEKTLEILGLGTERVEREIKKLFGNIEVARLDRDTIKHRRDLTQTLQAFSEQKTQVLVGTQMVAKGHDFPNVTLVGIVAGDASLNFPDFRAAERTFQLITQVAGRAGRGQKPGQVIVQAYETAHYAIQAALAHDYDTFIAQELRIRRELLYPPFVHLALLRFESENESLVCEEANKTATQLENVLPKDTHLLGPAWAPLSRLKKLWRQQILIKAPSRSALRFVLSALKPQVPYGVRRIIDVDPLQML
jgi:primosomal protein N' (replication factor Y) (superfamily II helicase)